MAPTTYMLIDLPVEGASDDVWDHLLNEAIQTKIDSHRHITGEGRQVPTAGINIDAALNFNAQRITNINGIALANLGADLSTGSDELYVSGNNLKFRNAAGVNVRITNGNALDVTTVGAIGGDYTSVGAAVSYVDASDSYTFKQQVGAGVRQYAKLESADVLLYEYKAHPAAAPPTTFVGLRSPAALGASYSITFPGAVPGSTLITQVSAAGVMTWSNTVANPVTLGGLLTANAGITLAANQDITLPVGIGRLKQATWSISFPAVGTVENTANAAWNYANHYCASTGATRVVIRVELPAFTKITQVDLEVAGNGVCVITSNAVRMDALGANTVASANATPGAAFQVLTINNAALAAAWTALGQTFSGFVTLLLMYEFSGNGGQVRRVMLTAEKV